MQVFQLKIYSKTLTLANESASYKYGRIFVFHKQYMCFFLVLGEGSNEKACESYQIHAKVTSALLGGMEMQYGGAFVLLLSNQEMYDSCSGNMVANSTPCFVCSLERILSAGSFAGFFTCLF